MAVRRYDTAKAVSAGPVKVLVRVTARHVSTRSFAVTRSKVFSSLWLQSLPAAATIFFLASTLVTSRTFVSWTQMAKRPLEDTDELIRMDADPSPPRMEKSIFRSLTCGRANSRKNGNGLLFVDMSITRRLTFILST